MKKLVFPEQTISIGDLYQVRNNYEYTNLHGLTGKVVRFHGDNIGLDLGIKVSGLTHSLDGSLPSETGRFFKRHEIVAREWDG